MTIKSSINVTFGVFIHEIRVFISLNFRLSFKSFWRGQLWILASGSLGCCKKIMNHEKNTLTNCLFTAFPFDSVDTYLCILARMFCILMLPLILSYLVFSSGMDSTSGCALASTCEHSGHG